MNADGDRVIGFENGSRLIERRSLHGCAFVFSEKIVPRVYSAIVDWVIYLYPSREAAKEGSHSGGTGFLVSVDTAAKRYIYGITNRHVIEESGAPFVRINMRDSSILPDIVEGKWKFHEKGDDVAACELSLSPAHKFEAIQS